jgi:hypothetical protein
MSAEKTNFREAIEEAAPGAFLTQGAPTTAIPDTAMSPVAAMRLIQQELAVEGIPERNLLNLSRSLVDTLAADLADAIKTLEVKGPLSESERKRVKTSVTH